MIEPSPGPLVDQEVVQARGGVGRRPRPASWRRACASSCSMRVVAGPDLAQEEAVHDPRGLHELGERVALVLGQRRDVGADVGRRERAVILELVSDGIAAAGWAESFTGVSRRRDADAAATNGSEQ